MNKRGYECGCRVSDNLFCSVYCVYDHLVSNHPVLWLRDSSLIRPGYISRNLMCDAGNVLAIWNGPLKGWRLRTYKEESLDEKPDPLRKEFVELGEKDVRFQAFLIMSDDSI